MNEVLHLDDVEPRFGDWGPGYVSRESAAAYGVVRLRPGDAFPAHVHERHTESFVVLEGRAELWLDRRGPFVLRPRALIHARPGVEHFLRNRFDEPFVALFVKTPWIDGDKLDVDWLPPDREDDPT